MVGWELPRITEHDKEHDCRARGRSPDMEIAAEYPNGEWGNGQRVRAVAKCWEWLKGCGKVGKA